MDLSEPMPRDELPRLNVLVVEDDASMAELLRLHLSNAGYVVNVCSDAIAAGYRLLKFTPDLLVLDVNLPHMSGLQFAATLIADTSIPCVPIIFITADEDFQSQAEILGADFIVKPFTKHRLLDSVVRVMASRPKRETIAPPAEFGNPASANMRDKSLRPGLS